MKPQKRVPVNLDLIKQAMERQGMSDEDLITVLDTSINRIRHILSGKEGMTRRQIKLLAGAIGLKYREIILRKEQK